MSSSSPIDWRHAKVPGFPLGFGNDDKAQEYLAKALTINPDGIDFN